MYLFWGLELNISILEHPFYTLFPKNLAPQSENLIRTLLRLWEHVKTCILILTRQANVSTQLIPNKFHFLILLGEFYFQLLKTHFLKMNMKWKPKGGIAFHQQNRSVLLSFQTRADATYHWWFLTVRNHILYPQTISNNKTISPLHCVSAPARLPQFLHLQSATAGSDCTGVSISVHQQFGSPRLYPSEHQQQN